jgi:hypothetical protein
MRPKGDAAMTDATPVPTDHPPTLPPRAHLLRYPDDPMKVDVVVDFVVVDTVEPERADFALRIAKAVMERMDYVIAHREGLLSNAGIPISTPPPA